MPHVVLRTRVLRVGRAARVTRGAARGAARAGLHAECSNRFAVLDGVTSIEHIAVTFIRRFSLYIRICHTVEDYGSDFTAAIGQPQFMEPDHQVGAVRKSEEHFW